MSMFEVLAIQSDAVGLEDRDQRVLVCYLHLNVTRFGTALFDVSVYPTFSNSR